VRTPQPIGQLLLFGSPNRYGLPAFYALYVWAWKENPKGTFVNWHPSVSCDTFNGHIRELAARNDDSGGSTTW
jgi:hypothetical protein